MSPAIAMNASKQTKLRTKFFQEDIVQRVSDPSSHGVVMRCWHDSDEAQPIEPTTDPLLRPLKRGEVGVSFYPTNLREILPESDFKLIDRPMQPGDVCKRRYEDMQSAVVTSVNIKFKGAHAVSGQKWDEWKTVNDIKEINDIAVGDFVAYNDWVGQVQDLFDESIVQIADGSLIRLPEVSVRLSVGERGADILPNPPEDGIQGILSYFLGDLRPSANDLVVSVKHTVIVIAWMAVNQMLTPEEAAARQRPQKFWSGSDISQLILLRGLNDQLPRVGDRLVFKEAPETMFTHHGQAGQGPGVVKVDTFVVSETQTTVDLLWQDGSQESVLSTELIPYLNPDEYDCWPGDHVVWKNEDEKQSAVVQSVNAAERTAEIILLNGHRELVSVLELDPHGTDANVSNPQEGFGVRRGDLVFIHREGSTNGCEKPLVPGIGELEAWVHESSFVEGDNRVVTGWQQELDNIGQQIARRTVPLVDCQPKRPNPGNSRINWFGEVTHLRLNGAVEVTLCDLSKIDVPLERLTRLNDGMEPLEDLWGDELSDGHSDDGYEDEGGKPFEVQTEDGRWLAYDGEDDDDWEPMKKPFETDGLQVGVSDAFGNRIVPGAWPSGDEEEDNPAPLACSTPRPEPATIESLASVDVSRQTNDEEPSEPSWKRFDILPSAPADHAFFSTPTGQPSRQFLARLNKEYRALSTSLPESIIVRTYEDRTDLLRSLIIGPENTPYEDAPFVIDWMLDANFPQTPPIAHFLSWTNGNGRVNPNLYEEGKVCLSILGTWAGDRSESWSSARSSLLQALVSIQGLVLVKDPWFCEPAYEKWRGTDEGRVNSRLYSEKAYVLSRGFVRRALELPLGSLQDVIKDIYLSRGRLEQVIKKSRGLIEKSKNTKESDDDDDLAVPRLTGGGVIPLTRTLDKLEGILALHDAIPSSPQATVSLG
ncbi:hypothetical protein DFH11DRAFT_1557864 [Phellopilus nigrolimitatus]|nr:hypothetical protein DFH11DRAFT_1557864 [Phellopilus nigrolimitatus]